eukprot:1434379-Prymnesium_polylepis.1
MPYLGRYDSILSSEDALLLFPRLDDGAVVIKDEQRSDAPPRPTRLGNSHVSLLSRNTVRVDAVLLGHPPVDTILGRASAGCGNKHVSARKSLGEEATLPHRAKPFDGVQRGEDFAVVERRQVHGRRREAVRERDKELDTERGDATVAVSAVQIGLVSQHAGRTPRAAAKIDFICS